MMENAAQAMEQTPVSKPLITPASSEVVAVLLGKELPGGGFEELEVKITEDQLENVDEYSPIDEKDGKKGQSSKVK